MPSNSVLCGGRRPIEKWTMLAIPARRNAGGEQSLHFRSNVQRALVLGVEERLDAIAVARGEQLLRPVIPDRERVFAAQPVHALRA